MAGKVSLLSVLLFAIPGALLANVPLPKFNDPRFGDQFYLNEKFGVSMNIYKAWARGYTGKNVTICVHDPAGVERTNVELASRFVIGGSFNYKTNTSDPMPDSGGLPDGDNAHGTMMAGLAAASANNGFCGVGVAYDAFVSGIKLFLSDPLNPSNVLKEEQMARTIEYGNNINDIYSCSWGLIDTFHSKIGSMSQVVEDAVKRSIETGRGGKGNIYVFANGNGGIFNGSCGFDEYITSIYTISISVLTGKNNRSRQNEKCSAVSAVTYARDSTSGIDNQDDLMATCGNKNTCAKTSGASSAAAAVASGILALLLQANPNLGWRDVQHLIARTSFTTFGTGSWITNKGGLKVSDEFGFGLLDANALTVTGKNWTNVGPQLTCIIQFNTSEPIDGIETTRKTIDLASWPTSCGGEAKRINFLEHVVLEIALNFTLRRNIEIEVISPNGTKSIILRSGRRFDSNKEIKKLSTMSLHFWGENPGGRWNMALRNVKPNSADSGTLFRWSWKFYGTSKDPMAPNRLINSTMSVTPTSGGRTSLTTTETPKKTVNDMLNTTSSSLLSTSNTSALTKFRNCCNSGSSSSGIRTLSVLLMAIVVLTALLH